MSSKKNPLFVPENFFLTRIPFFPIDYFFSLTEQEDTTKYILDFYKDNSYFREAIAIASSSLKEEANKNKLAKETTNSLLKYFSRMSSRPTPFGLFSFVSCGHVSEIISSEIVLEDVIKRARPDMAWLQNVIEKICADERVFPKLQVQQNPLLSTQGDRFSIAYFIKKTEQKSVSIRKNPLTEAIFLLAKNSITVDDLVQQTLSVIPQLNSEKVLEVIKILIEQQFLWFSLLPSLISSSPFQEFLKKVPSLYLDPLTTIHQKVLAYSSAPSSSGEELFTQINQEMKILAENVSYLQVDSVAPKLQITLPKALLEEVAEGAELLWFLYASRPTRTTYSTYFDNFVKKYGFHRLVPLYELLDESRGLGMPDFDAPIQRDKTTEESGYAKFQKWLQEAYVNCLWKKEQELEITDELVKKWFEKIDMHHAPLSFDIFFEVLANAVEEIRRGNYTIFITNIAQQGGATFGRFLDLFDANQQKQLQKFYEKEEALEPTVTFVESSYLPPAIKGQNVAIHPSFRKQIINLSPGGEATLSLDELYVGARQNHLFLTNKEGSLEYHITASNVLTQSFAPEPLRFIRDISSRKYRPCDFWDWGTFSERSFLPRVRYQKHILAAAQWNVSLEKIGAHAKESVDTTIEKFQSWAAFYHMARYIYITKRDNKLLLDRKNKNHLQIIANYLKKAQSLLLTEKFLQKEGEWITSSLGSHAAEFVVPMLKNRQYAKTTPPPIQMAHAEISAETRWRLPGSDWLYTKIYLPKQSERSFLTQHLSPFVDFLIQNKLIDKYFFIRYREEKQHLRIRFKGNPTTLNQEVLPVLNNWSHHLITDRIIQEISLGSYERELERYGGIDLIDSCENFFCIDSAMVLELLKIEKEIQLPTHVIGALSTLEMLKNLQLDPAMQIDFFEQTKIDRSELIGFKEWRKVLLSTPPIPLEAIFNKRSPALMELSHKMQGLAIHKKLTAPPFSIISSLIHMHCNRLVGVDQQAEKKIRAFAGYAIQNPFPKNS